MSPSLELLECAASDAAMRERIVGPLAEPETRARFAFSGAGIVIGLRDGEEVHGGLIATTYWDWMTIEVLAVPEEARGRGLGRRLLRLAERRAVERGCVGAWVGSYSFQSPGFYEAMGYRPFGRLPDYPRGEERIFYARHFGGDQAAQPSMDNAALAPEAFVEE